MRTDGFDERHLNSWFVGFAFLAFALLWSCSRNTAPRGPESASERRLGAMAHPGGLTISAAASTKDLVTVLTEEFKKSSRVETKLNFGASSILANQITSGAPVDLFLSASEQWASEVEEAGLSSSRVNLFTNRLVIVAHEANSAAIATPQDLLKPSVTKIALAGENVPAGIYAGQALTKLGLLEQLVHGKKIVRGHDVRTALSFVERGEAEAGIVYSTDVLVSSGVKIVYEFDASMHDPIVYVLVRLKESDTNDAAGKFVEYMQSAESREICTRLGFIQLDRSN